MSRKKTIVIVAYPTPCNIGTNCPMRVDPPEPRYCPAATSCKNNKFASNSFQVRIRLLSTDLSKDLEEDRDAAGEHGDEVDEEEGAAAVLVAQVREAPDVAKAHGDRNATASQNIHT